MILNDIPASFVITWFPTPIFHSPLSPVLSFRPLPCAYCLPPSPASHLPPTAYLLSIGKTLIFAKKSTDIALGVGAGIGTALRFIGRVKAGADAIHQLMDRLEKDPRPSKTSSAERLGLYNGGELVLERRQLFVEEPISWPNASDGSLWLTRKYAMGNRPFGARAH